MLTVRIVIFRKRYIVPNANKYFVGGGSHRNDSFRDGTTLHTATVLVV